MLSKLGPIFVSDGPSKPTIKIQNFSDILDRTNLAPLHTATNNDNVAVVSALVAAGANPNLHGIGGATPLHIGVSIGFSTSALSSSPLQITVL